MMYFELRACDSQDLRDNGCNTREERHVKTKIGTVVVPGLGKKEGYG